MSSSISSLVRPCLAISSCRSLLCPGVKLFPHCLQILGCCPVDVGLLSKPGSAPCRTRRLCPPPCRRYSQPPRPCHRGGYVACTTSNADASECYRPGSGGLPGRLPGAMFFLLLHHVAFWFDLLDRQPRDEPLVAYSHVTMAGRRGFAGK